MSLNDINSLSHTKCNCKYYIVFAPKYRRKGRYVKYGEALHRYPNRLNRDFTADQPNQKWVTDISYIRTGQGFLFLSITKLTTLELRRQFVA